MNRNTGKNIIRNRNKIKRTDKYKLETAIKIWLILCSG